MAQEACRIEVAERQWFRQPGMWRIIGPKEGADGVFIVEWKPLPNSIRVRSKRQRFDKPQNGGL